MNEKKNASLLTAYGKDIGLSLFGIADISGLREEFDLPAGLKARFPSALSLGIRIIDAVLEDIRDGPTPLYFHHYRQLNFFLDRAALLISSRIQDLGFRALPIPASQVVDWQRQRAHLSHKKIGELAGLGWLGRNNLLINPEFGARIRLASILTDMPLETDQPLGAGCEECRDCLSSCPAEAIKERPEDFDHFGCYEMLKVFRNKGLVSQFVCGLCVKACSGRLRSLRKP